MIKRIVKLSFQEEKVSDFLALFERSHRQIRAFPGCNHLELLRGTDQPNVFFTYSYWDSHQALENYRHSELFKDTWKETKKLFADKPKAWSVEQLY